jgi:hypothetical protein
MLYVVPPVALLLTAGVLVFAVRHIGRGARPDPLSGEASTLRQYDARIAEALPALSEGGTVIDTTK